MRRVGSIALGLVLLVAILFVTRTAPAPEQRLGNIVTSGRIGETVDTRGFTIRVERVRLARRVESTAFGGNGPVSTNGIWLVITATLVGDWEATTYDNTRLRTPDGRIYRSSERLRNSKLLTEDSETEPGIPRQGVIVFEVPPDALPGAVLNVAKGLASGSRLGPEAAVDLRISVDRARQLIADASPLLKLPSSGLGR